MNVPSYKHSRWLITLQKACDRCDNKQECYDADSIEHISSQSDSTVNMSVTACALFKSYFLLQMKS